MAEKLLGDVSFGLIRTNPKLTTNAKLTYTSNSELFINSIDASFELNKTDFKNYKTSSDSDYHWDLWRFWKKGITPNNITHGLGDVNDPTQVQQNYSNQYDLTYAAGAKYEDSRFYDEEFSYFAPIWLDRVLPEKFVIFRVDDPSQFKYTNIDEDNDLKRLQSEDPSKFKQYMLDNATIIKTIDLGPESEIGKYIRKYKRQSDFPAFPINIRYEKDSFTQFRGISLKKGDFSDESEKIHTSLVARDQSIIEFDNFVTKGFERNNLAIANIINLEFLFDDPEAEEFSINRYFGFYVNTVPEGVTTARSLEEIDENRVKITLDETPYSNNQIKDIAAIYYIKDKTDKFYKIDADSNWDQNEIIINERLGEDDQGLLGFSNPVFSAGGTSTDFKGFSYMEFDVTGMPRSGDYYYIGRELPEYGIFADHTIAKAGINHENRFSIQGSKEQIALAIKKAINYNYGNTVDLEFDSKFEVEHTTTAPIGGTYTNKTFTGVPENIDGVIPNLNSLVLIKNETIDSRNGIYTVTANNGGLLTLQRNTAFRLVEGDTVSVTKGISNSGDIFILDISGWFIFKATESKLNGNQFIRATTRGTKVLVYSTFAGSRYNTLEVTRNRHILNNVIKLNTNNGLFFGGSDATENRLAIDISFLELLEGDAFFVNTSNGFKEIRTLRFLGFPTRDTDGIITDFVRDDEFIIVEVESGSRILLNNFGNLSFYTFNKNEYGFFSIFPIKDFDFDFHSTENSSVDNKNMLAYYDKLKYKQFISGSVDLSDTSGSNYSNLLKYDYENTFKPFGNFTELLGLENSNGELVKVDSEYDRLNENFLKELSTYSRLSPFVTKWVKDGVNVKELPYRLNTSYAFGLDNFSPSFEIKTPNPQYFTHEWYYLGAYPNYVKKSDESVTDYYQFFDENFDMDAYLDPNRNYFEEYFTIEKKGDFFINPEIKYSEIERGSTRRFANTFFRGAKFYVKKRRENETRLDFNVDNLDFLQSSEYNGYKFSAVLQPTSHFYTLDYEQGSGEAETNGAGVPIDNPGESIPKLKFTVIENKKFKNITFLIEFKLPNTNLFKFYLDTIFLYTFKSIKLIRFNPVNSATGDNYIFNTQADFLTAIENGDFEFVYPDTPLTGIYDIRGDLDTNRYNRKLYQSSRKVDGIRSIENTFTQALKELTTNPDGVKNKIKLYRKGTQPHLWEVQDILKVVSDRIVFADSIGARENQYVEQGLGINFSNYNALNFYPYYEDGGFNFFRRQIEDASFANIFDLVNQGSPEVEYVTIPEDYDGTVPFEDLERNNFVIEFEKPFSIQKSKYLTVTQDTDIPPGLTTETEIGSTLKRENRVELLPMNRYGGEYFPKFRDVLLFTDKNSNREALKNLNREFDIENSEFGVIPNFYYSKVSPEAFNRILTVNPETGFSSRYPLIGEIGIDKKDLYIFKSNWDLGYYQKSINKNFTQPKFGTWNSIEQKNFLSSKIMKIPDVIRIEEFLAREEGDATISEFDIEYTRPTQDTVEMQVNLENRIISKLFELGIAEVFDEFVNYEYTLQNDREDFISDYIRFNVLPRYRIDEVIFWVLSSVGGLSLPLVFNELEDVEKIQQNFKQETGFNFQVRRNSNFNFVLNGNLNTSKFQSFSSAITVRLVKR